MTSTSREGLTSSPQVHKCYELFRFHDIVSNCLISNISWQGPYFTLVGVKAVSEGTMAKIAQPHLP